MIVIDKVAKVGQGDAREEGDRRAGEMEGGREGGTLDPSSGREETKRANALLQNRRLPPHHLT